MTFLRIALEKSQFIDSLVEDFKKIMKMLNVPILSFIILNLVKKGILDPSCYYSLWHIYMKEEIESCLRKALWRKVLEAMKELILTKLISSKSFFFTALSYLQDSLQYKQFLVPFIDSSSRLKEKYIKNFTEWTGKNLSRSPIFHQDLMIRDLFKMRHSNTGVYLWI